MNAPRALAPRRRSSQRSVAMARPSDNAGARDPRLPDAEACEALAAALGRFAVVDLETTGLDAATSRVIEVAAVLVAPGEEPVLYERLVDPGVPVPPLTQTLTGIDDAQLRGAPRWAE